MGITQLLVKVEEFLETGGIDKTVLLLRYNLGGCVRLGPGGRHMGTYLGV